MTSVRLDNVAKHFGQVIGARDINISIQEGEFFTFLGPSGCGKTTILRMIAGFYYPTAGSIWFDDENITFYPPNKRNTGMVFQNYALFPHMTVFENVAFGLEVRKIPKQDIVKKVETALARVRLDGYGSRRIDQLSGGQQQRVALARALVIDPKILLLDEPLSNLDAKLREETRSEIKRLQLEMGVTTIYVTHDQAEAMALSDRIMVMERGVVQQIGTPQVIYNRPANRFVASFIGETNLIEATISAVTEQEVTVQLDGGQITGLRENANSNVPLAPGSKVWLSIRPESFRTVTEEVGESLTGTVVLAEFTGVSMVYLVKLQQQTLRIMFVNEGGPMYKRGDQIRFGIVKQQVFFVE